jgi:hypothetical protein
MAYMNQETKKKLAPGIKAVLKKYGMKGTISVNNYSTLVVTVKSGKIDILKQNPHYNVNHYWIDKNYHGTAAKFLDELLAAMKGDSWFDNSDIMTDYFNTAWYTNIYVGTWNKPYQLEA